MGYRVKRLKAKLVDKFINQSIYDYKYIHTQAEHDGYIQRIIPQYDGEGHCDQTQCSMKQCLDTEIGHKSLRVPPFDITKKYQV